MNLCVDKPMITRCCYTQLALFDGQKRSEAILEKLIPSAPRFEDVYVTLDMFCEVAATSGALLVTCLAIPFIMLRTSILSAS